MPNFCRINLCLDIDEGMWSCNKIDIQIYKIPDLIKGPGFFISQQYQLFFDASDRSGLQRGMVWPISVCVFVHNQPI